MVEARRIAAQAKNEFDSMHGATDDQPYVKLGDASFRVALCARSSVNSLGRITRRSFFQSAIGKCHAAASTLGQPGYFVTSQQD
ncbi:hypothetical protein BG57_26020 [Caballeronia grimmiae]|uniref:Uncharacterized protein n=1 Tax=Caballeronia grimmiae TaxID=1071679 RepID=A0A069NF44_9BURK|nr:hypothetical protein BG57_26020 [Caballeronia grimmiae]